MSARASDALAALRARPTHVVLAALVAGLAIPPRAPVLVLALLAVVVLALAGRAALGLAAVLALVAGATLAQARVDALDRSRLGPQLDHATTLRVTLLEPARRERHGGHAALVGSGGERVLLRARAAVRWPDAPVGAELAVRGVLVRLRPGDGWLRARAVHATLRADWVAATGRARGGAAGLVDRVRERAESAMTAGLPPPQAALLRGMVLGDDAGLAETTRDAFRVAGLSHLTAASGQNVVLLAALGLGVCALLGVGLRARLALVLALIALYVPLAGSGPSIQRAGVMGAAGVVATIAGRPATRWYALLLAAAVTLALDPRALEQPGWQLSFAAVIAILALGSRLDRAVRARGLPGGLSEAVALTVAATIGTAPLVAMHFDRVSLVALPANVLAAPAVAPIMWLGMLAGAVGQLSTAAAAPIAAVAAAPLGYLSWLADVAAGAPGAQVGGPPWLVAVACVLVAGAVVSARVRRLAAPAALLALAVALGLAGAPASGAAPPARARVTFLDVGQGDATLIQDRVSAVLVDAGPLDGGVVAQLHHAGVRRLDALVVTHAQADHDGGARAVLAQLPVGLVVDGRDGLAEPLGRQMAAEARRRGVRLVAPAAGDVVRAGAIVLRVLWPPPRASQPLAGDDPNQRAVVAEASVGGLRVLLTADAESDVLADLSLRSVDVLKVSHHGSDDPGLPTLLSTLRPRVAGIEVGQGNGYGHPAPSTIDALRGAGVATYRTDRDGAVRVEPDGGALRVQIRA